MLLHIISDTVHVMAYTKNEVKVYIEIVQCIQFVLTSFSVAELLGVVFFMC